MIDKAIIFATKAHQDQCRKGTKIPYILHTLEAGIIVSQICKDKDLICAAILHDVLEDTETSVEELREEFNDRIVDLIVSESEDKSKSWKERKSHTIDSLARKKNVDIGIVTLGDKISNIRAIDRDFQEMGNELWERFNEKDRNEQKWYYSGLVESLCYLSEYSAYKEFKGMVEKVFK